MEANSCTRALQSLLQIIRKTNTDSRDEGKYFCKTKEEMNKDRTSTKTLLCLNFLATTEHLMVPANSSHEIQ